MTKVYLFHRRKPTDPTRKRSSLKYLVCLGLATCQALAIAGLGAFYRNSPVGRDLCLSENLAPHAHGAVKRPRTANSLTYTIIFARTSSNSNKRFCEAFMPRSCRTSSIFSPRAFTAIYHSYSKRALNTTVRRHVN